VDNLLRTNSGTLPEGGADNPAEVFYSDTIMLLGQPDMSAYAAGLPLTYVPPGAVWDYSNIGFCLASHQIRWAHHARST
jgi:CubicO group peptidase (beta-lactamase class C family)